MEDLVLVVGGALEGAGLVVPAGHEAGDGLEAVSVCQAGESLPPTPGHHAGQVWALVPPQEDWNITLTLNFEKLTVTTDLSVVIK